MDILLGIVIGYIVRWVQDKGGSAVIAWFKKEEASLTTKAPVSTPVTPVATPVAVAPVVPPTTK